MIVQIHDGGFTFTADVLNRCQQFVSFSEGIVWVLVQKLAAACAADME